MTKKKRIKKSSKEKRSIITININKKNKARHIKKSRKLSIFPKKKPQSTWLYKHLAEK